MRIAITVALMAGISTGVSAGMSGETPASAKEPERKLNAYISCGGYVPYRIQMVAQTIAGKMLASAGVKVHWRNGQPTPGGAKPTVILEVMTNTPAKLLPGALAFTKVYGDARITVFFDRLSGGPAPAALLAHVIVHEITHVLQGVSRHSETGVMKAHWDGDDQAVMTFKPLAFEPGDVTLLQRGFDKRFNQRASLEAK